jgi:hypothetical protein
MYHIRALTASGTSVCVLACAREMFSITHRDQGTGRGGSTARPPRSPDMNPLDFYLWEHLKALVCAAPVGSKKAFHHHIVMSVRLSATTPASLNGCDGP